MVSNDIVTMKTLASNHTNGWGGETFNFSVKFFNFDIHCSVNAHIIIAVIPSKGFQSANHLRTFPSWSVRIHGRYCFFEFLVTQSVKCVLPGNLTGKITNLKKGGKFRALR